jgi:Na+/H+ antiporter NhaC
MKVLLEFVKAGIASLFTVLVANNTISILLSGDIAKKARTKAQYSPPYRGAYSNV